MYDEFKIKGKEEWKESELYIWVIKPTGEVTFRRSDLKPLWQQQNTSLENLVTVARESIGVRGRGLGAMMREFYQNLQKNPNKAQALRQAMLTTMKNHPNPKNWAAFTLIGEAQ